MPELPEVETVKRGLEPVMAGRKLVRAEQRRPDLRFPLPERFAERLSGRRIERLGRRAKYLLAELDRGETLIVHLGMSGRMSIGKGAKQTTLGEYTYDTGADPAHDHVVLHLEGGATVTYNDPRRFGMMDLVATAEIDSHKLMRGLGPEPLGNHFDAAYLAGQAVGRRSDLKAFLLDQRVVAGLGNIYVAEALFRAGLKPSRAASCLAMKSGRPSERALRLVPAIRDVLMEAIEAGGSTLRDHRQADGALGYFQHRFRVYGRDGEGCVNPGCSGVVRRSVQAGRSTFHCARCQR